MELAQVTVFGAEVTEGGKAAGPGATAGERRGRNPSGVGVGWETKAQRWGGKGSESGEHRREAALETPS